MFAVTEVTTLLRGDLAWAGLGRAMLMLALVWWAWSAYVWVINAHDPDSVAVRVVLLLSAGLIFVAGLAIPRAFHSDGVLFAITYACVRLLHLGLYADAARRGRASWSAIAGFGATILIGVALLLGGALAPEGLRIGLWAAAAAIDYAGPAWLNRERLRGLQQIAVEHFAERYGEFIIICLGESVIGIGLGAQGRPLDASLLVAVVLVLVITAELWWAYFARFAGVGRERLAAAGDPVLAAADAYSYLHLLLVAGVIVFAVGARDEVARAGHALAGPARLALCAGVALYVVGGVASRGRLTRTVAWGALVAAGGCVAVWALTGAAAWWVPAAAVAVLLAAMLVWDELRGPSATPAAG